MGFRCVSVVGPQPKRTQSLTGKGSAGPERMDRMGEDWVKGVGGGAVAEGEAANPLEDPATDTVVAAAMEEEEGATVAVPVSPSDLLTMYFQAEGTMDESAIPVVSKALQVSEGISDVSVRVDEGIATVELTKQTTVQATGVASNLVEIIQGAGFKLQSLNLSFEDEEDAVAVR
ncbi:hypothetical protein ZIOFF_032774 [Zingiber officinale]|uniref:HMA domain-containing protein n=1 Tax=Zingiber officinale TaxID=94328 RepID=A0A8J5GN77_ZINOF|nr:hypothetical protein ZIOFF_032774 [Zingiber officinale]